MTVARERTGVFRKMGAGASGHVSVRKDLIAARYMLGMALWTMTRAKNKLHFLCFQGKTTELDDACTEALAVADRLTAEALNEVDKVFRAAGIKAADFSPSDQVKLPKAKAKIDEDEDDQDGDHERI